MRIFIFFIMLIIFCPVASAQTILQATVSKEYNTQSAREEAFRDIEYTKNLSIFPARDPDYAENKQALDNGYSKVGNKIIDLFSDKTYCVRNIQNGLFDKKFYYKPSGELFSICYTRFPDQLKTLEDVPNVDLTNVFPVKEYLYGYPAGNIELIAINVGNQECFVFTPDGKLNSHWVKGNGYNANGELEMTAKTVVFPGR